MLKQISSLKTSFVNIFFKVCLDPVDQVRLEDKVVITIKIITKLRSRVIKKLEERGIHKLKKNVFRFIRCSRPTLTKWMAAGKIPFSRKGRRVYFFRPEVLKALEQPLNIIK